MAWGFPYANGIYKLGGKVNGTRGAISVRKGGKMPEVLPLLIIGEMTRGRGECNNNNPHRRAP